MGDLNLEVTTGTAKAGEFSATDKRGRIIAIRKPPFVAQFDLIDALGASASNETYRSMVLPLLFVASIDGDAITRPQTKAQARALIQRLDEDGFEAVSKLIQEHFGDEDAPTVDEDAVKND